MAPLLGSIWLRTERDPGSANLGLLMPRGPGVGQHMRVQDTGDADPLSMPRVTSCPVPAAPATHVGAKTTNNRRGLEGAGFGPARACRRALCLFPAAGMDLETVGATLSVLSARHRSRAALADGGSDSGAGGSAAAPTALQTRRGRSNCRSSSVMARVGPQQAGRLPAPLWMRHHAHHR